MKALDSTYLGRPKLETFIVTGQQLSRFDGPCDLWRRFRIERPVQKEKDPLQARGMETNTAEVSSHRLRLTQVWQLTQFFASCRSGHQLNFTLLAFLTIEDKNVFTKINRKK